MISPSAHEVTCPLCGGAGVVSALRIGLIKLAVARHFSISVSELVSQSQDETTVRARHIGMYLARHLMGRSYQTIAWAFGRADHSSAWHAVRKIRHDLHTAGVDADIRSLMKVLAVSGFHDRAE